MAHLQREEELLSKWWREYGECSEGPIESHIGSDIKSDQEPKLSKDEHSRQSFAAEEERVGVPVKGGLFEVFIIPCHAPVSSNDLYLPISRSLR